MKQTKKLWALSIFVYNSQGGYKVHHAPSICLANNENEAIKIGQQEAIRINDIRDWPLSNSSVLAIEIPAEFMVHALENKG